MLVLQTDTERGFTMNVHFYDNCPEANHDTDSLAFEIEEVNCVECLTQHAAHTA